MDVWTGPIKFDEPRWRAKVSDHTVQTFGVDLVSNVEDAIGQHALSCSHTVTMVHQTEIQPNQWIRLKKRRKNKDLIWNVKGKNSMISES